MKILETERLILRTFEVSDFDGMLAINQDPQVMAHFPGLVDAVGTQTLIDKINQHYTEYGYSLYAVELKSTGEFIGFVGLLTPGFDAHFTPNTEIGWRLSQRHWGFGYAPEAAHAVLAYAFNILELPELVSFTVVNNSNSRRVMEKIGLKHDEKDDFNHPNLSADSPLSRHVLYRLSREDYLSGLSLT
ncbi:MAG: GNAT family N-acetyltransferase [Legionellaceae bacterium]|nr:GNAT family N-acetyltransferase [Legionellaceae bacterium]